MIAVKKILWAAGGALALGCGGISAFALFSPPKVVSPTAPALGVTSISQKNPIVIRLNRPLDTSTLHKEIFPTLPGIWKVHTNLLLQTTLTFTPEESAHLDTRYSVSLTGIKARFGTKQSNYLLSFQTDSAPKVVSVTPVDGDTNVLPDQPLTVVFDKELPDSLSFFYTLTPEVALVPAAVSDTTVSLTHEKPFTKSTDYTLTVFKADTTTRYSDGVKKVSEEKTSIFSSAFKTVDAPGVSEYAPSGKDIDPATPIRIVFKQEMDHAATEAAFSLAPEHEGVMTWENDRTFVFTPTGNFAKNQEYTVTLSKQAKAANGVSLDEDFMFRFTTLGVVTVASIQPADGTTGIATNAAIKVTFNQDVQHESAESLFTLSPTVAGSFSWDGRSMTYTPHDDFSYSTQYTVTIRAGVKSVKGLDGTEDFSSRFTTRAQSVLLNVAAYRQIYMYSCMTAAARSALAYRGTHVSEADIISRVPVDHTPWSGTWGQDNSIWGDPYTAIVGNLDGKADDIGWGYGSYWDPIAAAIRSYGILVDVRTNMTVQDLAREIAAGNPVVIWWVNGVWPAYVVNWHTPAGRAIRGVNSLHVQVVKGFTGTVDNPTAFTVTDSGYGYPGRTFDVGTFKAKWAWFSNTGIVVK